MRTIINELDKGYSTAHLGSRFEPVAEDLAGSSLTVPAGADGVPGLAKVLAGHEPQLRA